VQTNTPPPLQTLPLLTLNSWRPGGSSSVLLHTSPSLHCRGGAASSSQPPSCSSPPTTLRKVPNSALCFTMNFTSRHPDGRSGAGGAAAAGGPEDERDGGATAAGAPAAAAAGTGAVAAGSRGCGRWRFSPNRAVRRCCCSSARFACASAAARLVCASDATWWSRCVWDAAAVRAASSTAKICQGSSCSVASCRSYTSAGDSRRPLGLADLLPPAASSAATTCLAAARAAARPGGGTWMTRFSPGSHSRRPSWRTTTYCGRWGRCVRCVR
jgi:hypothetical protein